MPVFKKDFTAGLRQSPQPDASAQVLGTPQQPAIQRPKNEHKALMVELGKVYPDPTQPRRAIPRVVRVRWGQSDWDANALWDIWFDEADREHPGSSDYLMAVLSGDRGIDDNYQATVPVEQSLLIIVGFAVSIREKGVINPITATTGDGEHYIIETGERRWLAHHLLSALEPDNLRYQYIPVIPQRQSDTFRQAAENTQRQNLNMIARARQYALLLMAVNPDEQITPYSECESDRAFYAQALNLGIPKGRRKDVLAAMGISSPGQLTRYRELLQFDDEIWDRADDENWSQDLLFTVVNSSDSKRENTSKPAQKPREKAERVERTFVERTEKAFLDFNARIEKLERKISKDTDTDYSVFEPWIDEQIRRLQQLKKRVRS